jgi:hypothetical protein
VLEASYGRISEVGSLFAKGSAAVASLGNPAGWLVVLGPGRMGHLDTAVRRNASSRVGLHTRVTGRAC